MPPSASLSCSPPTRATVPFSQRVMPLPVSTLPTMRVPGSGGGHVLRGGLVAPPQQLHEHQRLVDGAHAHAFGDERAQAEEGSRGAGGHGVMVAAAANPAPGVGVPPQSPTPALVRRVDKGPSL
jgi:hypothetical protein